MMLRKFWILNHTNWKPREHGINFIATFSEGPFCRNRKFGSIHGTERLVISGYSRQRDDSFTVFCCL